MVDSYDSDIQIASRSDEFGVCYGIVNKVLGRRNTANSGREDVKKSTSESERPLLPSDARVQEVWAAVEGRLLTLPPNLRGTLWLLVSSLLFTFVGVIAKHLGARLDGFQIGFFRAFAAALIALPFLIRAGSRSFKSKRPWLQVLRAVAGAVSIVANFYAYIHLPLADVTSLSFSRNLFVVPLAIFFLGEIVGWRRIAATMTGFIGVLIMLRPTVSIEPAAMGAVIGALCLAIAATSVKVLARTDSLATLLFYSGVCGTLLLAIPTALAWKTPTTQEWFLLILMGVIAVSAQGCFIRAFATGEATALAPVDYVRLLLAGIAGYFFFGDLPDVWTYAGSAVIIASTLYITRREAKLGKNEPPPTPLAAPDTPITDKKSKSRV